MDARLIYGQLFMERILRAVVFNWLPESVKLKGSVKGLDFRPQASFLPQVPTRGVAPVLPQKVSQRYLDEQAKLNVREDVDVYPSQPPPLSDGRNPHVMIVGAGLAGLLLGILLDHAGIPYKIYERAKEVKPLGAVMTLNAGVFPALEQLGLYEELVKLSLPVTRTSVFHGDMTEIITLKTKLADVIGYDHIVFPRPEFYDLVLSRVPREKIHFSKKVLSMEQNKEGVMIRCSDRTTYHGDILVGADGAYSGVRQALYKRMDKAGTLPPSDLDELNKGYICMVGTTRPLDPAKYSGVEGKDASIYQIVGRNSNYSWSVFTIPGNRICWSVKLQLLTVKEATQHKFKNSEWGSDTSDPMIKEVRDFLIPMGGTMGDLIDSSPRETISRVFLEDKLFDTWHHGRTLLPSAGLGAVTAMQDAVVLANCIYEMKGLKLEDIDEAFVEFKNERYPKLQAQYSASQTTAKLLYGQGWFDKFLRVVVFSLLPESFKLKGAYKGMEFRPQASFIPQVPVRGTAPVLPQKPSLRYQAEQTQLNNEEEHASVSVSAVV
ncbi:hypothetical protein BG015_000747 [Linnemannia schmuckeri]|uniref:FAD-binding domain-containing protein n=1 Tax=Linnemannia schmuckeri TaxID=64567 RepID=A0A9P5RR62_9FUNG|nr:hypothetical protein BG015_000747 [Linnemannia schmuckeri]